MPAASTWRKQLAATTPMGEVAGCGSANATSAGGLEAYDTTMGRSPSPEPPENEP
jgi:hypothetical protein